MRYAVRAPLRIDFGGGWTDMPLYAEREGGAVLSAAITRYVRGYIARPDANAPDVIRAMRGHRSYLSYSTDVPVDADLGVSAAETVAWVTLVRSSVSNTADRRQIAEMSCGIARNLGILGGVQDEYVSALGGITYFTFDDAVRDERLALSMATVESLLGRLVLVYVGQQHPPSTIQEDVWSRYRAGDRQVAGALSALKRVAGEMREALLSGELDAFDGLLDENWAAQKALSPSVTYEKIEKVLDIARGLGARAGKACGVAGGSVLLFTRPRGADDLRRALRALRFNTIEFDFDTYGVYLSKG